MPGAPSFHLFLPQMRMTIDAIVERAQAAESAGFEGIALMDHLVPPMAEDQPMYEAIPTATWIAAHTSTLLVGHLVLCDAVRHPAVLAKQAVTIDHASQGRFELGIGWGSVPDELDTFGIGDTAPRARVARFAETLAVIERCWSGELFDFKGEHFTIEGGRQQPTPLRRIPIVIGGAGPKTLALVAQYADWWNVPLHRLDAFDEMAPKRGKARISMQHMIGFVPDEDRRADVADAAHRRFGRMGVVVGDGRELVDHYRALHERGVERFYVWFTDFAPLPTLAAFGEQVIAAL